MKIPAQSPAGQRYQSLEKYMKEASLLSSIGSLLGWDQETFMPPKAAEGRAAQLAMISGMVHDRMTAPRVGEDLAFLEEAIKKNEDVLLVDQHVNVAEWSREYRKQKCLSREMVEEFAQTTSKAQGVWSEAKKNGDFDHFAPWLEKNIKLKKQIAILVGGLSDKATPDQIYDVLLDEYEPGMSTAQISAILSPLRSEMVALVKKVVAKAKPVREVKGNYPIAKQQMLEGRVMQAFGFDFDRGRVDLSSHPFSTSLGPMDHRVTTRYLESDFTNSLSSILHETGHAMYDQGLPLEKWGTPAGSSGGMGIHESQSRFWENQIGRSREFCELLLPWAEEEYGSEFSGWTVDQFYGWINQVEPGMIRVDADEATYNLHILLRFEIERGVIGGSISVSDLPKVWNAKMQEYLGVTPPNDSVGVLQDVHWAFAGFGYFPTYSLGNLFAAQWRHKIMKEMPDFNARIRRGDFADILGWHRKHIHQNGRRFTGLETCARATGESLNAKYFLDYLNEKYAGIYEI